MKSVAVTPSTMQLVKAQSYVWFPFPQSGLSDTTHAVPKPDLTLTVRVAIRVLLYSCIRDEALRAVFDGCLLPPPYILPPVHDGEGTEDTDPFTAEEVTAAARAIPNELIAVVVSMPLNFAVSTGVYDSRLRAAARKLVHIFSHQLVDSTATLVAVDESATPLSLPAGLSIPRESAITNRDISDDSALAPVSWGLVINLERRLASLNVSELAKSEEKEQRSSLEAEKKKFPVKRVALIGVASLIGAAALAVTGGLAAPLVAPALVAVVGATASTLGAAGAIAGAILGGSALAGVFAAMIGVVSQAGALAALIAPILSAANLTAIFGVGGAGLAGYRAHTRLGGLDEFVLRPLRDAPWWGLLNWAPFSDSDPVTYAIVERSSALRGLLRGESVDPTESSIVDDDGDTTLLDKVPTEDYEIGITYMGAAFNGSVRDVVIHNSKLSLGLTNYRRVCVLGVDNRLNLASSLTLELFATSLSRGIWVHYPTFSIPSGSCGVSVCRNRGNRPTGAGGMTIYKIQRAVPKGEGETTNGDDPYEQLEASLVGGLLFIRCFYTFFGGTEVSVAYRGAADVDGADVEGLRNVLPGVLKELSRRSHTDVSHFTFPLLENGEMVVQGSCSEKGSYISFKLDPSAIRSAARQAFLYNLSHEESADFSKAPSLSFQGSSFTDKSTGVAPSINALLKDSCSQLFEKRAVLLAIENELFMGSDDLSEQSCVVEVDALQTAAGSPKPEFSYQFPDAPWRSCVFPFVNDSTIPSPAGGRVVLRLQYREDTCDPIRTVYAVLDAKVNRLEDFKAAAVILAKRGGEELPSPKFQKKPFRVDAIEGTETQLPFEIQVGIDPKLRAVVFTLKNKSGRLPSAPLHLNPQSTGKRMTLTIAVGGYAGMLDPRVEEGDQQLGIWQAALIRESEGDIPNPIVDEAESEMYVLQWESQRQRQFFSLVGVDGESAASQLVAKKAMGAATGQVKSKLLKGAMFSAFHAVETLTGAFSLPMYTIWATNRVLDNAYATLRGRAQKAGRELALALLSDLRGNRPITLVGYSLGASVIYYCLQKLFSVGARAIVENVYLIGACVEVEFEEWRKAQAVVAGRLVNVYNRSDWTLWALHRANTPGHRPLAGMSRVPLVGIENVDASALIDCHGQYAVSLRQVLDLIPPLPTPETCQATTFTSSPGALVPFSDLLTAADRVMEAMQDAVLLERPRCCILSHSNRLLAVQHKQDVGAAAPTANSTVPMIFIGDILYGGVFDFAPPSLTLGGQSGVAGLVSTRDPGVLKQLASDVLRRVSRHDTTGVEELEDQSCVCGVYGFAVPLESITDKYTMVVLCFVDYSKHREASAKRALGSRYCAVKGVVGGCKVLLVPARVSSTESDHQVGLRLKGIVEHYGADSRLVSQLARTGCFTEPIVVEVPIEKGPLGTEGGAVCPIKVAWTQKGEHFTLAVSGVLSSVPSLMKQPTEGAAVMTEGSLESVVEVSPSRPTEHTHAVPSHNGSGLLSFETLVATSRMFSLAVDGGVSSEVVNPSSQGASRRAASPDPLGKIQVISDGVGGEPVLLRPLEELQEGLATLQSSFDAGLNANHETVVLSVGRSKGLKLVDEDVAEFDESFNNTLVGLATGELLNAAAVDDHDDSVDALAATLRQAVPNVFVLWIEGNNVPTVLDKFELVVPLVMANCFDKGCDLEVHSDLFPAATHPFISPGQCGLTALRWSIEDAQKLVSAHEAAIDDLLSKHKSLVEIGLDEIRFTRKTDGALVGSLTIIGKLTLVAPQDTMGGASEEEEASQRIQIQLAAANATDGAVGQIALSKKRCHVEGAKQKQLPFWQVFVFPKL